jgi:hypothetical protein
MIVNSQIQEMNILQQTLIDLERTQQMLKKQLRIEHIYVYLQWLMVDIGMKKRYLD